NLRGGGASAPAAADRDYRRRLRWNCSHASASTVQRRNRSDRPAKSPHFPATALSSGDGDSRPVGNRGANSATRQKTKEPFRDYGGGDPRRSDLPIPRHYFPGCWSEEDRVRLSGARHWDATELFRS